MSVMKLKEYLQVMLELVEEGGQIALDLISGSSPELKSDESVVTQADYRISQLAAVKLAPFLADGHILVDEEDPCCSSYLDNKTLDEHPFVWSLDPIDATRPYANGMPYYGISIGLIKNRLPWLGAVYFPSLRELFYCDGDAAYFVKQAFTDSEVRVKLVPRDDEISSRSLFIATDEILNYFEWRKIDCRVVVFAAAVCEFCWPTIGRGAGSLSRVNLWDFAGAWPIFQQAGLKLFALNSGQVLDRLDVDLFEGGVSSWKLKDYYILSSERNYPLFKARLSKKDSSVICGGGCDAQLAGEV